MVINYHSLKNYHYQFTFELIQMKLQLYYIIISLLLSNALFADITPSEYEDLIDHVNCEFGRYLIQDGKTSEHFEAYNEAIVNCGFVNMIEFYKSKEPFLKKNGEIAYLINDLKEKYIADNPQMLYDSTIHIFNESILINYAQTLTNRADYDSIKNKLTQEIKEKILAKPKVKTALDNDVVPKGGNSVFDIVKHPGWLWLILILFIIMAVRTAMKIYSTRNDVPIQKSIPIAKEIPITKPIQPIPVKQPKVEKQEVEVKKPKEVVDTPKEKTVPQFIQDLQDKKKLSKETFYMPPPSVSGSFYSFGRMNEFKVDQALFKFEIVSEKYQICQFFVVNDPNVVTQGMMDFEKYLYPACTSENQPFPAATQIITIKPGVARRSTNHWRVQQKALIKFV